MTDAKEKSKDNLETKPEAKAGIATDKKPEIQTQDTKKEEAKAPTKTGTDTKTEIQTQETKKEENKALTKSVSAARHKSAKSLHSVNKENLDTITEAKAETKTDANQPQETKKDEKAPTKAVSKARSKQTPSELLGLNVPTSRLRMRKYSIGMSSILSVRRHEMASSMGLEYKRPFLVYEPTFQLEPLTRFDRYQVEKTVNEVLDRSYEDHKYNEDSSPALAVKVANTIMREVKYMLFNRYRVLSIVVIGQKRAQSYNNTISFIWDPQRDAYVDVSRENLTSFIQVTVFGIYLD